MKTCFVESDITQGTTPCALMDKILVVCPHCASCARITQLTHQAANLFAPHRLVCLHCGFSKDWAGHSLSYNWRGQPPLDPYFQFPLWLSASCCGEVLCFFNVRHLSLIEDYVRADLREHHKHPQYGWDNQSLFNRRPKWVKAAKHREPVLKSIEKLRQTV